MQYNIYSGKGPSRTAALKALAAALNKHQHGLHINSFTEPMFELDETAYAKPEEAWTATVMLGLVD